LWWVWLENQPVLILLWGGAIVIMAMPYAWATVVFGIRFSNLTHRGIITTGPYRFFKHPAYLAKSLMWWLVHMPFLLLVGPTEAFANCVLLLTVNAIYYTRAKTEEKHLMEDPDYQAYSDWIRENGLFARLLGRSR